MDPDTPRHKRAVALSLARALKVGAGFLALFAEGLFVGTGSGCNVLES